MDIAIDSCSCVLFVVVFIVVTLILITIVLLLLRHKRRSKHPYIPQQKIKVCLVLGSGGHTAELLRLVSHLDPDRYFYRHYVIASSDQLSQTKMQQTEQQISAGNVQTHYITRARKVHQSYFSSIFSTLHGVYDAVKIMLTMKPDLVLTTGPGTCIPVCVAAFLMDLLCIKSCYIVFIESVCRVQTFSLSALILYYTRIADKIVVQWQELKKKYQKTEYLGVL